MQKQEQPSFEDQLSPELKNDYIIIQEKEKELGHLYFELGKIEIMKPILKENAEKLHAKISELANTFNSKLMLEKLESEKEEITE